MRFVVAVLACMGVCVASLALADPPSTSPQQSAPATPAAPAAPAAPAPAAAATPAAPASPARPDVDPLEQHFLAEGYRMQMRHGERVFCRREEVLGSRLASGLNCNSAAQLKATEDQARAALERAQRHSQTQTGN